MDRVQREPEPSADTACLLAQITNLQAELRSLRARHDVLLEANNRAAAHYKADYKKWRNFKRWLCEDFKKDDEVKLLLKAGELDAYKTASTLGKRKQFEVFGPKLEYPDGENSDVEEHQRDSSRALFRYRR
ncbi:hypothetical protein BS17DRAFT_691691 [Gyrodon lividus]|nr:hypothetical protein BS17DRAFT_691691 [Gyrodon lividus]